MHKLLLKLPPYTLSMVVILAILYLTLVPKPVPDNDLIEIPGMDKVIHAIMFGGLTLVLAVDSSRRTDTMPTVSRRYLIIFAVSAAVFGGIIEIAQQAMDMGRGGDIFDFFADSAGAALFAWLSNPVISFVRKH